MCHKTEKQNKKMIMKQLENVSFKRGMFEVSIYSYKYYDCNLHKSFCIKIACNRLNMFIFQS